MHKLAIIGDSDSILAFQAIGMDSFLVNRENAQEVLSHQFKSGKYAIIFLAETLAQGMMDFLQEVGHHTTPAITIIPVGLKRQNIGLERMRKLGILATGTDIISQT